MAFGFQVEVTGVPEPGLPLPNMVEVHERLGEPTTFRVNYAVDIGDADMTLLSNRHLGPGAEIAVVAAVDQQRHVLVKGPVHGQRIRLVHGGSGSWLDVCGSDQSIVMDRELRRQVWDNVHSSDVVRTIVKRHGLADDVEDTRDEHHERKHTLVQADTDLRFVRRLARWCGTLFWITTDAAGKSTAHFRRPPLQGAPAARLVISRRDPSQPNIATLDIAWDVERATRVDARQLDVNTKSVIDGGVSVSPLAALGKQPLAAVAGGVRTTQVVAAVDAVGDLAQRAEAALIQEGWFIEASCDTSLNALGKVVRAHTVVEVLGAGTVHSGKYLVAGVRHAISAEEHVMELKLCRNAWGAQ
jgi:phage protein D